MNQVGELINRKVIRFGKPFNLLIDFVAGNGNLAAFALGKNQYPVLYALNNFRTMNTEGFGTQIISRDLLAVSFGHHSGKK